MCVQTTLAAGSSLAVEMLLWENRLRWEWLCEAVAPDHTARPVRGWAPLVIWVHLDGARSEELALVQIWQSSWTRRCHQRPERDGCWTGCCVRQSRRRGRRRVRLVEAISCSELGAYYRRRVKHRTTRRGIYVVDGITVPVDAVGAAGADGARMARRHDWCSKR